jgi:hypothetical protein
MVQLTNPINIILLGNSFLTVIFILNQNETNKDLTTSSNSSSLTNPFEKFTWVCLFIQLVLFLIKTKTTDF